jgi:hypothetical protein
MSEMQLDITQRRYVARKLRGLLNIGDKPKTMAEACEIRKISRTQAYRILEELELWESKHTHDQEIADISTQLGTIKPGLTWATCDTSKWFLTSGKLTLAYAQGDFDPNLNIAVSTPQDKLLG